MKPTRELRAPNAATELAIHKHPYSNEKVIVPVAVPSHTHWIIVSAAVLNGVYCPTCTPSTAETGKPEHHLTKFRHEATCARTRDDL